ncbi:MAG: hypothetical protein R2822_06325 [Spirosomataceae bacterium]
MPNNERTLAEGKALYGRYCQHCLVKVVQEMELLADMYKGVPNYKADAYLNMTDGHIFHVITLEKVVCGLMAHK